MTTKKNRTQVNFEIGGPGLAVKQAQNVPFIPATQRSGVGNNAKRMSSALQGLGSALAKFGASGGFGDQETGKTVAKRQAEERRYSKYVADQGKEGPEERVARETVDSHAPSIINQFEEDAALKKTIETSMKPEMLAQISRWKDNGFMIGDDTGGAEKADAKYVQQFFKDYRKQNIYGVYGKGLGKEGELNAPQLKRLQRFADQSEILAMTTLTEHNASKHLTKSLNITASAASQQLVEGVMNRLPRDKLTTGFFGSAEESFRVLYGKPSLSPEERATVHKNHMASLTAEIERTGSDRLARAASEILGGNVGHGRTTEQTYPAYAKKLKAAAVRVIKKTDTNEKKNKMMEEAYDDFVKGRITDFQSRAAMLHNGQTEVTVSKKELEAFAKSRIVQKSKMDLDVDENPENRWEAMQAVVSKFSSSGLIHDEAKLPFTPAAWRIAAEGDGTDLARTLDLYRTIRNEDRDQLEKYIPDAGMRSRMALLDSLTNAAPHTTPADLVIQVENAIDKDTGKVVTWEKAWPGGKAVFNKQLKNKEFRKLGLSREDESTLSDVVRARVALRVDATGDGDFNEADIKKIVEEETLNITSQYERINGTNIYAPVFDNPDKTISAPVFRGMVEKSLATIARGLDISQSDIRITPLPNKRGYSFSDQKGNVLVHPKSDRKMILFNEDIERHFKTTTSASNQSSIISSMGSVSADKALHSAEKLEAARKSVKDKESWWTMKNLDNTKITPLSVTPGSFTTDVSSNTGSPRSVGNLGKPKAKKKKAPTDRRSLSDRPKKLSESEQRTVGNPMTETPRGRTFLSQGNATDVVGKGRNRK